MILPHQLICVFFKEQTTDIGYTSLYIYEVQRRGIILKTPYSLQVIFAYTHFTRIIMHFFHCIQTVSVENKLLLLYDFR